MTLRKSRVRLSHISAVLAMSLLVLLSGCTPEDDATAPVQDVELPEWIDSVSPFPGAEAAPTDIIVVQHNERAEFRGVRIIIDGTDVTSYAVIDQQDPPVGDIDNADNQQFDAEGLLTYDPNSEQVPVTIDPGEHTVTLEQVRIPEEGAQMEVLDTFEWSFTVR